MKGKVRYVGPIWFLFGKVGFIKYQQGTICGVDFPGSGLLEVADTSLRSVKEKSRMSQFADAISDAVRKRRKLTSKESL